MKLESNTIAESFKKIRMCGIQLKYNSSDRLTDRIIDRLTNL